MRNSLALIREQKGLDRKDLAKETGYTYKTVSAYETRETKLPKDFLQKAAEALGVSIEDIEMEPPRGFLKEEPIPYNTGAVRVELLTDDQLRDLDAHLSQEQWKHLGTHRSKIEESLKAIGLERHKRAEAARISSGGYTPEQDAALRKHYGAVVAGDDERAASESPGSKPRTGAHPSKATGEDSPKTQAPAVPPLTREARRSQK